MARKFLTPEQTNYIQGRLKMLGENSVTLAARLGRPWSTVAGTINGNRANPEVRQAIADFLEEPVEKLFGSPQVENNGPQVEKEGPQVANLGYEDGVSHG
jgi:hypothetical protein